MNEVKQFLIKYTSGLVRIEHAMVDSVKAFCNQHFGLEDPSQFNVAVTMHDADEDLSHHLTGQQLDAEVQPATPAPTPAPTTAPQTAPADAAAAPQADAQAANATPAGTTAAPQPQPQPADGANDGQ